MQHRSYRHIDYRSIIRNQDFYDAMRNAQFKVLCKNNLLIEDRDDNVSYHAAIAFMNSLLPIKDYLDTH